MFGHSSSRRAPSTNARTNSVCLCKLRAGRSVMSCSKPNRSQQQTTTTTKAASSDNNEREKSHASEQRQVFLSSPPPLLDVLCACVGAFAPTPPPAVCLCSRLTPLLPRTTLRKVNTNSSQVCLCVCCRWHLVHVLLACERAVSALHFA